MDWRVPCHPGEVIAESLHDMELTASALAAALGISRSTLHRLLCGARAMTPEVALALERQGWSTAEQWMRMQAAHDLARLRRDTAPQAA